MDCSLVALIDIIKVKVTVHRVIDSFVNFIEMVLVIEQGSIKE